VERRERVAMSEALVVFFASLAIWIVIDAPGFGMFVLRAYQFFTGRLP
jgi:hypothetical protein